jgi:hypothetical protein
MVNASRVEGCLSYALIVDATCTPIECRCSVGNGWVPVVLFGQGGSGSGGFLRGPLL